MHGVFDIYTRIKHLIYGSLVYVVRKIMVRLTLKHVVM